MMVLNIIRQFNIKVNCYNYYHIISSCPLFINSVQRMIFKRPYNNTGGAWLRWTSGKNWKNKCQLTKEGITPLICGGNTCCCCCVPMWAASCGGPRSTAGPAPPCDQDPSVWGRRLSEGCCWRWGGCCPLTTTPTSGPVRVGPPSPDDRLGNSCWNWGLR